MTEALDAFRVAVGSVRERAVTLFLLPRAEGGAVAREVVAELHVADNAAGLLEAIAERLLRDRASARLSLPSFWEHTTPFALARTLIHQLQRAWSDAHRRRGPRSEDASSILSAVSAFHEEVFTLQIGVSDVGPGHPPSWRRALFEPPPPSDGGPLCPPS